MATTNASPRATTLYTLLIEEAARTFDPVKENPLLIWCDALWAAAREGSCGVTIERFSVRPHPNPKYPSDKGWLQPCTLDASETSTFGWWAGVIMPDAAEASRRLCMSFADAIERGGERKDGKSEKPVGGDKPPRAMSTKELVKELQTRVAPDEELVAAYDEFGSDRAAADGLSKRKGFKVSRHMVQRARWRERGKKVKDAHGPGRSILDPSDAD